MGGYKGISFSGGDISNFQDGSQGSVKYVGAGTAIFILVIDDPKKAKNCKNIQSKWKRARKCGKGTFQDNVNDAVKAAIKNCGFCYYKANSGSSRGTLVK